MKKIVQKSSKSLLISGPCSAETAEQLMRTGKQLADVGKIDYLRAGIWKPRTRPGSFEGIGKSALPWLLDVKKETGLKTAVEVATAQQVEEVLKFDVDLLWIGARTTVNPFSVQDLANALQGVDIPIFIKNPIHPDIELWIGAVERMAKAGIKNIGLIHRGFSSYGNEQYRNAPMWHISIEMKRRFPDLVFICDPSHIGGKRDRIFSIAQKALDLNFDGLMIETHFDPENAWSDAKQQITPNDLNQILNKLTYRQEYVGKDIFQNGLEKLRDQIDQIDDELIQLLAHRMQVSDLMGAFKKENKITILQTKRWNEIFEKTFTKGKSMGLSDDFIMRYLEAIHLESIRHQHNVMND